MLRLTCDVRVHMTVELEPARDAGLDQPLDSAEDGRAAQGWLGAAHLLVKLPGRELATGAGEGLGDDQSLLRHSFAGSRQSRGGGIDHQLTLAQPRLRIMLG